MKGTKALGPAVMLFLVLGAPLPDALAGVTSVTSCVTITKSGSYLVSQVLKHNGDCIKVQADFVTLDLGGFSITGNGSGNAITDNGSGRQGIVVRNGTISNFSNAINFQASSGSRIEGIRAIGNSNHGIIVGDGSTVTGCAVLGNMNKGIRGTSNDKLTDNVVENNGEIGIDAGASAIVTGNTANGNTSNGINAGTGSLVRGNTANDNEAPGMVIDSGSTVTGNTARGNATSGIDVTCPTTIVENTAVNNPPGCTVGVNCMNLVTTAGGCTKGDNTTP